MGAGAEEEAEEEAEETGETEEMELMEEAGEANEANKVKAEEAAGEAAETEARFKETIQMPLSLCVCTRWRKRLMAGCVSAWSMSCVHKL